MKRNGTQFERLSQLMCDYQDEYELDKENAWVKAQEQARDKLDKTMGGVTDACHDYAYSLQYLGFIQGVHFAFDVMELLGSGKNKELVGKLLEILETEKEEV